jgi:hypothetical protein
MNIAFIITRVRPVGQPMAYASADIYKSGGIKPEKRIYDKFVEIK